MCNHDSKEIKDDNAGKMRCAFLLYNLFGVFLISLAGILVYQYTNSLAIKLDFLGSSCDMVAVIINLAMEGLKMWMNDARTVLTLDLSGCLLSLATLAAVSILGMVDASMRVQAQPEELNHVDNLDVMVIYSGFTVLVSLTTLGFFAFLKDSMIPPDSGKGVKDQLNMLSSLVHAVVGCVNDCAVFGTSVYLRFGSFKARSREEKAVCKMRIDVYGAMIVCGCIIASSMFLFRDAYYTMHELREMDKKVEDEAPESKCESMVGGAPVPQHYGTMKPSKSHS